MKVPAVKPPPLKNPGLIPNGLLPLSPLHLDRLGLFNPDVMWRYQQLGASSHPPVSPLIDVKSRLPSCLAADPRTWMRDDVNLFLRWCEQEFDIPTVDQERFQMNGKALCLLTKSDLSERTGGAGDVIFNVLQMLLREVPYYGRGVTASPLTPQQHAFMPFPQGGQGMMSPPASAKTPNSAQWPPRSPFFLSETNSLNHLIQQTTSVAISDQKQNSPTDAKPPTFVNSNGSLAGSSSNSGSQSDSEESSREAGSPRRSPPPTLSISIPQSPSSYSSSQTKGDQPVKLEPSEGDVNSHGRLLWDFLQLLLNDNQARYTRFIAWKHHESGIFKIVDPPGLAKLWGIQKNHPSMNYDKMSRALRYYYRVNILRKVQGERHCYQFLRNPSELKSIKNISMLRQQMQQSSAGMQPPTTTPLATFDPKTDYEMKPDIKTECYDINYSNNDIDMPTDLSIGNSERRHEKVTTHEFNLGKVPVELVCQPSFPNQDTETRQARSSPSFQFSSVTQVDLDNQYQQLNLSIGNVDRTHEHVNSHEFTLRKTPVELLCQPSFPAQDTDVRQARSSPSFQFSGVTQGDLDNQYQQNIRLTA
ncbi:ets DNA-binding protein pokkuri-like isoform X2 [Artemia franciscana]|uniref:Ets DNA-binding protein pokkuri n=1 Tax=Artemia franciscana TaxID=6661 RepID=A0AA88I1H5_ARTSF|nr:hypothetical protein QYM36_010828 [Artemia franciscana]KAK2716402.1 hypothetical protein QYM36_010828 [Artemia franciscana]